MDKEISYDDMINIILKIPKDTVALKIKAHIYRDGAIEEAESSIGVDEVRQARQDFLDNVEAGDEYDAVYKLTEKGKAYLEELKKNGELPYEY